MQFLTKRDKALCWVLKARDEVGCGVGVRSEVQLTHSNGSISSS